MIRLTQDLQQGLKLRSSGKQVPANLLPVVYKCKDCGSTIRYLEATDSYFLMNISKEVEQGKKPICQYCDRLRELKGPAE